jgi:hypothetical protein
VMSIRRHIEYAKYLIRHKWFVFLAGWNLGIPLLALMHDNSKFRPSEWFPYARFFYEPDGTKRTKRDKTGYYKPTDTGNADFDFAWLLHQKRNKHHWQWWVLPEDGGGIKVLEMPDKYRREMIADWIGAGQAQGTPDTRHWYIANRHKMQLHPTTRALVEDYLYLMYHDKNIFTEYKAPDEE